MCINDLAFQGSRQSSFPQTGGMKRNLFLYTRMFVEYLTILSSHECRARLLGPQIRRAIQQRGLIPLTQVPLYVVSERSASVRGIARKPGHGAGPFARRVPEGIRRRGELRHVPVQVSLAPRLRLSRLRQAPRQRA